MSAVEHLKRLVEEVNSGQATNLRSAQGNAIERSIATRRRRSANLKYELDEVQDHGDRVAFRYTAHGANGSWCGSGCASLKGEELHVDQHSEDYIGRRIAEGRIADFFSAADPQDNITGDWTGELFGVKFTMDLNQKPPSDAVTGTISALGSSFPLTGTNNPPNVAASGSSDGKTIKFSGQWTGPNTIDGTISGDGFNNKVTITR